MSCGIFKFYDIETLDKVDIIPVAVDFLAKKMQQDGKFWGLKSEKNMTTKVERFDWLTVFTKQACTKEMIRMIDGTI